MSEKYYQANDPALQTIFDQATERRPFFVTRPQRDRVAIPSPSETSVKVASSVVPLGAGQAHEGSFDERVEYVFSAFRAAYGNRFTSARSAQELIDFKLMWQSVLKSFDLNEVKQAVQSSITTLRWPPSIIEFLERLQIERTGFDLPSPEQAYHEACMHAASPSSARWTHVAIYHAGRDTGWYRLRSDSSYAVSKTFAHHYDRYVQRVMAGEVLEQPKNSTETPHAVRMKLQHDEATAFIQDMIEHYSTCGKDTLDEVVVSEVFFYLTLPEGPVRNALRRKAEAKVQSEGLPFPLPLPEIL